MEMCLQLVTKSFAEMSF